MPKSRARWYFDFTSYYSYLQLEKLTALGIEDFLPVPVELGAIFAHWDNRGPHAIKPKREFSIRQARWIAGKLGVAFQMPPVYPFSTRNLSLLAIELGGSVPVVRTLFRAIYQDGEDPTHLEDIRRMASALGIDPMQSIFSERNIKALELNNAAAIGCGVFGTPTIVYQDSLFWGFDATEMFLEAADLATPTSPFPRKRILELG